MSQISIRPAAAEDVGTLLRLIKQLAEFEKLAHMVRASEADLLREGFGPTPRYEALLAELDGTAVGFALYFHTFSTFTGRSGLHLEDIFVAQSARGREHRQDRRRPAAQAPAGQAARGLSGGMS